MKDDVIDLSSDGEDCCEDAHDEDSSGMDNKRFFKDQCETAGLVDCQTPSGKATVEWSLPTKDSAKRDLAIENRQVQDNGACKQAMKMATDQSHSTTATFLGASSFTGNPETIIQEKLMSRRFWKAGDYEVHASSSTIMPNGMDHVRVHPKFLHSNATSHKWALGAIAELLDNAIDEVANGATVVRVDKVANSRDNSPTLLIQDDGGGMDPDSMRHCMSLGYSRKSSNMTIGQYGNGFKTSTMRLGADVIVFSRCSRNRCVTQSIGLLSYTFLRSTGHEDIVVPMVDFELSPSDGKPKMLVRTKKDDWLNNLATVLQWSPFNTESDLLKQFDDIGDHGTKIIIYNLWMNDDGELELDFETDKQDIQVKGASKLDKSDTLQKQLTNQHIANRLRFSLRAYASILYLRMPSNFQIILRGEVVEHLSIAEDLKFKERILYKPQIGNSKDLHCKEVSVITTIGFAKEAPMVSVHGFNVYHKNRLIMPFWKVFQENSSRGRGVVGVLEANFMEPAHDKQDFERTPILQRLETRLKQMTIEYWNLHCDLIGYQPPKYAGKGRGPSNSQSTVVMEIPGQTTWEADPVLNSQNEGRPGENSAPSTPPQPGSDAACNQTEPTCGPVLAKKPAVGATPSESSKRQKLSGAGSIASTSPVNQKPIVAAKDGLVSAPMNSGSDMTEVLEELEQLRARCAKYRCREQELKLKVAELELELLESKRKYRALVGECPELKRPKQEF